MDEIKITGSNFIKPSAKKPETIKHISAKLHPEYDQDLIQRIKLIPKRERSKIYRDALRKFLDDTGMK